MAEHTPGPWTIEEYGDDETPSLVIHKDSQTRVCFMATPGSMDDPDKIEADACLIVAAPDMLAALRNVRALIAEAAATGFNWKDGDWAERLFASQQVTSAAIRKAEYRP